jgi:hypothetical protein
MANVLDLLPGPVKVLMMIFRRFTRDATVAKIIDVENKRDFKGNLVADAILKNI